MAEFKNVMEVFKLLEKSNCGECDNSTCLAFASKVYQGTLPLSDCPRVPAEVAERYGVQEKKPPGNEDDAQRALAKMKEKVAGIDFSEAAGRIGASFDGNKLTVKVFGRNFAVDRNGKLYSDIHVNPWVTGPLLSYVLYCQGAPVSGSWMSMRELPGGKDWYRFFEHQCIKRMKKVADAYTELFEDMVDLFNGQQIDSHYQSDIAVALYPLPLVPLLVCYWKPEEGMESDLNVFFDANAERNLGIEGLYSLGAGIVRMFEKLAQRHGVEAA